MKPEMFERILETIPGARKDGGALVIPEESEVSVYLSLPSEVLQIPRVSRVERSGDLWTLETHAGDRYYVQPELVVMLKVAAQSKKSGLRGAGFR